MNLEKLSEFIEEFNQTTHGSTDYHKAETFIKGQSGEDFVPLNFVSKKSSEKIDSSSFIQFGYIHRSYDLFGDDKFKNWYEKQFSRKLTVGAARKISILEIPNIKEVFDTVETVHRCYQLLKENNILLNGKNLPVQLGEWYARCIFGLNQKKSASQRGFDFHLAGKRVEVKVTWSDIPSPKGVKLRKSLVELSDYTIIVYLAKNFMIREICFLDSDFVIRKFFTKGHTLFLKDGDINSYFFSKSSKHRGKVVNSTALLKYSSPTFAMNIADDFN